MLQFVEAKKLYADGMTFDQVRTTFGEPTTKMESKRYVFWTYMPISHPGAQPTGFEIQFHEGKSCRIGPSEMRPK